MMARELYSRSAAAAAAAEPIAPILCPKHADYRDADGPAWPDDPNIGLQEGDDNTLMMLGAELTKGLKSEVLPSKKIGGPLQRAVLAYKLLPQSYKNKLWRKAADDLIATRHDNLLVPDSEFLPPGMRPMWEGMGCQATCPDNLDDNKLCPWKDDCKAFYDVRQPRWDRQKETSEICYTRWLVEGELRRRAALDVAKAERYRIKMEQQRIRLAAEKELSRTMFNPEIFENGANDITALIEHITEYIQTYGQHPVAHPDSAIIPSMMQVLRSNTPLTVLDFQCLIADYFHDGIPGFRVANLDNPKISGIRVHDLDIIRIGKKLHHTFMYRFLQNILTMMETQENPTRFRLISSELKRASDVRKESKERNASLFTLPEAKENPNNPRDMSHMHALEEWRKSIGLHGGRIEDSIGPLLGIPHIGGEHTYYGVSLEHVKTSNPMAIYDAYLTSKKKYLMIKLEKDETKTLTQQQADIVLTFILLVLFGPSYQQKIAQDPAMFTFDAHKGHMNRIIERSTLPHTYRLVTPYNVADSAMTETFDPVQHDQAMGVENDEELAEVDRQVAAKIAEELEEERERAKQSNAYRNIKQDEVGQEDEDEDDQPPQAQGRNYFAFSLRHRDLRAEVSHTNMIFDKHWSIYYKNKNFREGSQYDFSMNLMDSGLHHYIERKGKPRISPSLYTIEAPFSAQATRGPSLNYLMMGLLRGSKSNVFDLTHQQGFNTHDALYQKLYDYREVANNPDLIKKLLPIYSIPVSSHALPLFQYIAKAPLFACHMLYDLQHKISALPSRIKWAGDREQYMALQGYDTGAFVTLDTTGYYCALANGITSLLERKGSIIMIGSKVKETLRGSSTMTPLRQAKFKASTSPEENPIQNDEEHEDIEPPREKKARKGGRNLRYTYKSIRPFLHAKQRTHKSVRASPQETTQDNKYTIDRNYLFLGWLYPLVMAVHEAFHDRHRAEDAYIILQNLKSHVHHPLLFSILQEQFLQVIVLIPDRPEKLELLAFVKDITMDTYDSIAPQCASLLKDLYTLPSLTIFSNPIHKETLLGYLREMKQKLSKRYPSKDSTLDLLHTLLDPSYPNQETACLVLSLLFERLHGRIQNGTSYLGQILGITGGPALKRVDDQEAWEYLTTVMEEDMKRIAELAAPATPPKTAIPQKARNVSAKLGHVVRRSDIRKLKRALTHYRPKNGHHASRAPTRAPDHPSRAPTRQGLASHVTPITKHAPQVAMGGSMKTRRAKKGSRRHRKD